MRKRGVIGLMVHLGDHVTVDGKAWKIVGLEQTQHPQRSSIVIERIGLFGRPKRMRITSPALTA